VPPTDVEPPSTTTTKAAVAAVGGSGQASERGAPVAALQDIAIRTSPTDTAPTPAPFSPADDENPPTPPWAQRPCLGKPTARIVDGQLLGRQLNRR